MEEIRTIEENPVEEIDTLEEAIQTIIIGVESLDGQTGNLTTKTINGEAILGEGNIETATASDIASAVAVEKSAREEADAGLQTAINGKQDALTQTQLSAVNSGIDSTKVAQIATNAGNIADIDAVIPNQASSSNQLADRNFVNSSIATNTANYISNNGEPFTSVEQLEAYSGVVTNNDYAFVVGTDSAGNVTYTRYKYNSTTGEWAEEYVLNNSSFTSDQWTAINSGITSGDVTKLAGIQAGAQVNTIESISVNGTPITPDVNKNVAITTASYTAGAGLTLEGNEFSVTEPAPAGYFSDTNATVSGDGTYITLNNTSSTVLKDYQLKGDTKQTTYTGKNLFGGLTYIGKGNIASYSLNGNTLTITPSSTTSAMYISFYLGVNIPAETVHLHSETTICSAFQLRNSSDSTVANFGGSTNSTKTLTGIADRAVFNFAATGTLDTFTVDLSTLIIEKGDSFTSYEPYVGGVPSPNPDYPQDVNVVTGTQTVKVTGKNLFGFSVGTLTKYPLTLDTTNDDNSVTLTANLTTGAQYSLLVLDGFDPTKTYSFSAKGKKLVAGSGNNARIRVTFGGSQDGTTWTSLGQNGTNVDSPTVGSEYALGRTLTGYSHYRMYFYNDTGNPVSSDEKTTYYDIQLELGPTSTAYEPYKGHSYTISLGSLELCKIGTAQDYIYKSGDDWYVHKEIGKLTWSGSDDEYWSYTSGAHPRFTIQNSTVKRPASTTTTADIKSDNFTPAPVGSIYSGQDCAIGIHSDYNQFWVSYFAYTSADSFKTWLSTHNTTVYYALNTPTDTKITDTALIAQLEALWNARSVSGQTIIMNSAVSPNPAGILTVDAFKNNLVGTNAGYTEEIARLQAEMNSSLANIETALHTINNGGN